MALANHTRIIEVIGLDRSENIFYTPVSLIFCVKPSIRTPHRLSKTILTTFYVPRDWRFSESVTSLVNHTSWTILRQPYSRQNSLRICSDNRKTPQPFWNSNLVSTEQLCIHLSITLRVTLSQNVSNLARFFQACKILRMKWKITFSHKNCQFPLCFLRQYYI